MHTPDIAIIYDERLPSSAFDKFKSSLNDARLNIVVDSKPPSDTQAALEWFIPTAIVAYIGKSYFDGFLKEMGKNHYLLLKEELSILTNETMSKPNIEPQLIDSKDKVAKSNSYSLLFSIYAEARDGNSFKLLIPKASEIKDYALMISTFLDFLNDFYSGASSLESTGYSSTTNTPGNLILLHMNTETNAIEWLDEKLHS